MERRIQGPETDLHRTHRVGRRLVRMFGKRRGAQLRTGRSCAHRERASVADVPPTPDSTPRPDHDSSVCHSSRRRHQAWRALDRVSGGRGPRHDPPCPRRWFGQPPRLGVGFVGVRARPVPSRLVPRRCDDRLHERVFLRRREGHLARRRRRDGSTGPVRRPGPDAVRRLSRILARRGPGRGDVLQLGADRERVARVYLDPHRYSQRSGR